jgi:hypothetical protein
LGANLPKNRSHTAYLARARLADVHLGTPAAALTTNWPKSMSEPVADAHLGIADRSGPESAFKLPKRHRRRMRPSNPIERSIQQEIQRQTQTLRVFPNEASRERLVTAILVEIDETWNASRQIYDN